MKTLICSLVLLLACTQAHGRRLLQDDGVSVRGCS